MVSSPTISYPVTDWVDGAEYKTDNLLQNIGGTVNVIGAEIASGTILITIQVRYKIKRGGVEGSYSSYTDAGITVGSTVAGVDALPWFFNSFNIVSSQVGDRITYQFKTVERRNVNNTAGYVISESTPVSIIAEIVSEEQIESTLELPSGVKLYRAREYIKVLVPESAIVLNSSTEFVGANFYISLNPGGGTNGYQQMNDMYVTDTDEAEEETTTLNQSSRTNQASEITVTTTTSRQVTNNFYTFTFTKSVLTDLVNDGKLRNIFLADGTSIDPDTTFYFVTTLIAYDETLSQVIESPYSVELEGKFLEYSTEFQTLPPRSRSDVLFSITKRIISNNSKANVISGSVIRDIIDPLALEFEKFYVIQDFVFATLSVDTLLAFDDSDGDGFSDPLSQNVTKRRLADALAITDEITFQLLIDEQFDRLAANFNLTRNDAVPASGKVVFYTTSEPTTDILIPEGTIVTAPGDANQGTEAQNFSVIGTRIMSAGNASYYYNASRGRYEIEADIQAESAGTEGNVASGAISVVDGLNPLIQVENTIPTDFGEDRESNQRLSDRIKLAQISYDSGTEGGYSSTTLKIPGILQVRVEKVGDPLMVRDYEKTIKEHIGGKVDIYIKGERLVQTVDQIAFKYEYPTDTFGNKIGEIFSIINAAEFRLRAINPKVTSSTPIVSVTSVRNVTRGQNYSIQNVRIVGDGDTVVLENNQINNTIGMASFDVVEVNYKYRSSNVLTLSNQPVREIISVTDSNDTLIDTNRYILVKKQNPLREGYSSISQDGVEFLFTSSTQFDEFIDVTDEEHDLFLNIPSALNYKGVDVDTIVVKDSVDTSIVYIKDVDYSITTGSETAYTYINLLLNSKIRQGDRVSVDYRAAQNFNITYVNNSLINQVQTEVNNMKHATADTIIKESVGNNIDLSFRVIRKTGIDSTTLKARIQTAVANYVSKLNMGETFTQGALINVVKSVNGVKEIQMPLIRMMKRNGSFIPLEELGKLSFQVYQKTSSRGVSSYITLQDVLEEETIENGGPNNLFRSIYEDNIALLLVNNPSDVAQGSGRAYIQSDGKIIVSTTDGAPPQTKNYSAAYYVNYSEGTNIVKDLEVSEIEYLKVDSLSLRDIEILDDKVVKRGL